MASYPSSAEFHTFKDCLAQRVIPKFNSAADASDPASDLDDFVSYLAAEIWPSLPASLRDASYETRTSLPDLETLSLDNMSTSATDTLVSYELASDVEHCHAFIRKVLEIYVKDTTSPPPIWSKTRTEECEICEREVPLTYHHLIPRSVQEKALRKGWHKEAMINSVAWLCRPCHSVVHSVASNEDLARYYHTIELILERDDVQKWRKWRASVLASVFLEQNAPREVLESQR